MSFKNDLIKKIFHETTLQTKVYLRLCTDATVANATTAGTECAYGGYAAGGVGVDPTAANWPDTDNEVANANDIEAAVATSGTENIRYVEAWKDNTSSSLLDRIGWCQLAADLAITTGGKPVIEAGNCVFSV